MKVLSTEVKALLDKMYNLRGEDSIILSKMDEEKIAAIDTEKRTKEEKEKLNSKLEVLNNEETKLADEGNKLSSILASLKKEDFATVLTRLDIDFDPEKISDKLNAMLPDTIKKLAEEKEKAVKDLENIENEMQTAITKLKELELRKEEALDNQAKLNEFFDLALKGNINITRDAITSLLEKFNFSEDEQREAAKILMFPEDALYEYDASLKSSDKSGKTITEVLAEAKKESEEKEVVIPEDAPNLEKTFATVFEENVPNEEVKEEAKKGEETVITEEKESLLGTSENDLQIETTKETPEKEKNNDKLKEELLYLGKTAEDIDLVSSILQKTDIAKNIEIIKNKGLSIKEIPLIALENIDWLDTYLSCREKLDLTREKPEKFIMSLVLGYKNVGLLEKYGINLTKAKEWIVCTYDKTTLEKNILRAEEFGFIEGYKQNPLFLKSPVDDVIKRMGKLESLNVPYKNDKGKYQSYLFNECNYQKVLSQVESMKK